MCNKIKKHVVIKIFNITKLKKKNKAHIEFIINYLREILINKRIINAINIQKNFCFQYEKSNKNN